MKKRILFIGEGVTLAHVVRPLTLARTLDSRRYEVHFACPATYRDLIDEAFRFHELSSTSPAEFDNILRRGKELFPEERLNTYVLDDMELLSRVEPDVVVGDLRLSLAVSAPCMHIPYVSISSGCWSPSVCDTSIPLPTAFPFSLVSRCCTPGSSLFEVAEACFQRVVPKLLSKQARGLNAVREKYGLPAFESYLEGFTFSDFTLYADTPRVAPTAQLPGNHRYIGPLLWSPDVTMPAWWRTLPEDEPLVFLNMGSSGDRTAFESVLQALGDIDATLVIATAGRRNIANVPEASFVEDYLPGKLLAERADLVITNGGSPSSYQALSKGKPVIGVASNMDQVLTMRNIERCGAGILLRTDSITSDRVTAAVSSLLSKDSFTESARAVAEEFKRYDAHEIFENVLDKLSATDALVRDGSTL